jgi:hypothetical protein
MPVIGLVRKRPYQLFALWPVTPPYCYPFLLPYPVAMIYYLLHSFESVGNIVLFSCTIVSNKCLATFIAARSFPSPWRRIITGFVWIRLLSIMRLTGLIQENRLILFPCRGRVRRFTTYSGPARAFGMIPLHRENWSLVRKYPVDGGYSGKQFANAVTEVCGAEVVVVKCNKLHTFVVISKGWVVDRTVCFGRTVNTPSTILAKCSCWL